MRPRREGTLSLRSGPPPDNAPPGLATLPLALLVEPGLVALTACQLTPIPDNQPELEALRLVSRREQAGWGCREPRLEFGIVFWVIPTSRPRNCRTAT